MRAQTPPESVHALDLNAYISPGLHLWTVWRKDKLAGCGALKDHGVLDGEHLGEIKTMRTKEIFLRQGVADTVLSTIVAFAKKQGIQRLSLETGKTEHFQAAQLFYERKGFQITEPFAHYKLDPHSVFYTIHIG
ncbi:UNVERIFIED_CONTAM: hypothetical protein GTU68_054853 [Idotea baltica]|nr:hypothetical protein [Idotea baltica]